MTKGEKIRRARDAAGLTQDELARAVGTTKQTIYKYEMDIITNIPWSRLERIAQKLGVSSAYIMGWSEYPGIRTRQVPRVGAIACGDPILAEQNAETYDTVPDFVDCDFTIICHGDSMTGARINHGDIVCVKAQSTADDGQIAVVCIDGAGDDYEATLKRIRYVENGVALWPENPAYAPMVFTGDAANRVHIQGIAKYFISNVK